MKRLLIVGHGRMGRLVEQLAPQYDFEVAGILDIDTNPGGEGVTADRCRGIEVAVDFSAAEATLATAPKLAALGVSLVIGTTGWQAREAEVRRAVARARRRRRGRRRTSRLAPTCSTRWSSRRAASSRTQRATAPSSTSRTTR